MTTKDCQGSGYMELENALVALGWDKEGLKQLRYQWLYSYKEEE